MSKKVQSNIIRYDKCLNTVFKVESCADLKEVGWRRNVQCAGFTKEAKTHIYIPAFIFD